MFMKVLLLLVISTFSLLAEEQINSRKPDVYMGRQIAYTMHANAANWLTRTSREKEESTQEMINALELKEGMVVADVGCGNGYQSLMMAKLVGVKGKVLCVDIQPTMLKLLKGRANKAAVKNLETILGEYEDPNLPKQKVDLILLVDAYHEFTKPAEMLAKMHESLTEKGVIVLVEFRKEDKTVPIKEDHKMSKVQIMKELEANSFKLVRSYDKLPWQHMMIFGKADK